MSEMDIYQILGWSNYYKKKQRANHFIHIAHYIKQKHFSVQHGVKYGKEAQQFPDTLQEKVENSLLNLKSLYNCDK